jgi:hypothetical protein
LPLFFFFARDQLSDDDEKRPFTITGSEHTYGIEKAWRFCVGAGHPSGIKKAINTPKHFTGQLFEGDSSDPWGNGTTVNRQSNDTRYVLRDLEQYYLPVRKRRQNGLFLEFSLCLSRACLGTNDDFYT